MASPPYASPQNLIPAYENLGKSISELAELPGRFITQVKEIRGHEAAEKRAETKLGLDIKADDRAETKAGEQTLAASQSLKIGEQQLRKYNLDISELVKNIKEADTSRDALQAARVGGMEQLVKLYPSLNNKQARSQFNSMKKEEIARTLVNAGKTKQAEALAIGNMGGNHSTDEIKSYQGSIPMTLEFLNRNPQEVTEDYKGRTLEKQQNFFDKVFIPKWNDYKKNNDLTKSNSKEVLRRLTGMPDEAPESWYYKKASSFLNQQLQTPTEAAGLKAAETKETRTEGLDLQKLIKDQKAFQNQAIDNGVAASKLGKLDGAVDFAIEARQHKSVADNPELKDIGFETARADAQMTQEERAKFAAQVLNSEQKSRYRDPAKLKAMINKTYPGLKKHFGDMTPEEIHELVPPTQQPEKRSFLGIEFGRRSPSETERDPRKITPPKPRKTPPEGKGIIPPPGSKSPGIKPPPKRKGPPDRTGLLQDDTLDIGSTQESLASGVRSSPRFS